VLRIEQARALAGRSEPDIALDNWEALVEGRWSLVDRFDNDGKRYVIAVINDPAHPDPRGLTSRERQVAELVGLARSTKQISYSLGITNSAVTNSTSRIQEKLVCLLRSNSLAFFLRAVFGASWRKSPWPASGFSLAPIRSSTSGGSKT
jgi:DNA-binding NarL/FixJ family response regulator